MPRILGIQGSPRRDGNTAILLDRVLEAAARAGAAVDRLVLADITIRECDGCHACWKGKPCSKHDDMSGTYDRIAAADVLIFGTPVYWYGPTALMKAFVDRFVYFNCPENRPKIRGKSVILVVPYEDTAADTGEMVIRFFEKCFAYLEMNLVGRIIVPGVGERGEALGKPDALHECDIIGARLGERRPA